MNERLDTEQEAKGRDDVLVAHNPAAQRLGDIAQKPHEEGWEEQGYRHIQGTKERFEKDIVMIKWYGK